VGGSCLRRLYTALFHLVTPLVVARLLWRSRKAPDYRRRIAERFGCYRDAAAVPHVWFHAVSVGEAEAAFPLLRKLRERFPQERFVVTTTTPTGSRRVRDVLGESVAHVYLPYDLPGPVGRFLGAFRPRLAVILETEIWPNLYQACAASGIPLAIVNARLSERSARGYGRLPELTRDSLAAVTWLAAQSAADAERFRNLGVAAERVEVTGNLKFDLQLPDDVALRGGDIRNGLFRGRPTVVAGSTHEGEEEWLLESLAQLLGQFPDLLLVLAPRHPERFDAVAELCRRRGLAVTRRSSGAEVLESPVFLLDTLGELRQFYAAGDVAYVGGSLVARGGHNPLEPAALGLPVLFGPQVFNFQEISRGLLDSGGAGQVGDGAGLTAELRHLLEDPSQRQTMGRASRSFVERGRGALQRVAAHLAQWLEPQRHE